MTAVDVTTGEVLELASIGEAEAVIERGLETFVKVGNALAAIRDHRWHHDAGYRNFDDYCQQRWGMSRRHSARLIAAAEVIGDLEVAPIGATSDAVDDLESGPIGPLSDEGILPATESQARPLTKLPTAEDRQDAWQQAVAAAQAEGRKPTAADVADAVDAKLGKPASVTTRTSESTTVVLPVEAEPEPPTIVLDSLGDPTLILRRNFARMWVQANHMKALNPETLAQSFDLNEIPFYEGCFRDLRDWADSVLAAMKPGLKAVQ